MYWCVLECPNQDVSMWEETDKNDMIVKWQAKLSPTMHSIAAGNRYALTKYLTNLVWSIVVVNNVNLLHFWGQSCGAKHAIKEGSKSRTKYAHSFTNLW